MFNNTITLSNGVVVPQLCIRYDIQLGMIVLPKTANPEHIKDACDAAKVKLSHNDWYQLYLSSGKYLP